MDEIKKEGIEENKKREETCIEGASEKADASEHAPGSYVLTSPTIICCTRPVEDFLEMPLRDPLPHVKLEKSETTGETFYMLKKFVRVMGVNIAVLDVLDTRNTFYWVKVLREKVERYRWSEEEVMGIIRHAVSQEILREIVQDADTVREAIRRIYDKVYTKKATAALAYRIQTLKSAHFNDFVDFERELSLLIDSYSVKQMMSPEKKERVVRECFWEGLSENVKELLRDKISPKMAPERILKVIKEYRARLMQRYPLPKHYKGLVHVKAGSTVHISVSGPVMEGAVSKTVNTNAVSPSKPANSSTVGAVPAPACPAAPVPAPFSVPPSKFESIIAAPEEIFRDALKNAPREGMRFYSALVNLTRAPEFFVPNTKYAEEAVDAPYEIEAIYRNDMISAVLVQNSSPLAVFYVPVDEDHVIEYMDKTTTEKEVFAIHNAFCYFQDMIRDQPVSFASTTYQTLSGCMFK